MNAHEQPNEHALTFPPELVRERLASADPELATTWEAVTTFAAEVEQTGGRAYLVGGAVRDQVLGRRPKDFDVEVHGLPAAIVERLAQNLGSVKSVGQSFGVMKIRHGQHNLDISLPRRETKTGAGHRDFSVGIDPQMDLRSAAGRRDFTLGAIYQDIVSGAVEDPYGGVPDLRAGILRMVRRETFLEDPLRVLRGMQFAARFGLTAEPSTVATMREMVPEMGNLSPERIRDEWKKLVLADRPSLGLQLGRETGYVEQWQPELSALWTTPQDPHHHPEGDVWNHTLLVLDQLKRVMVGQKFSTESRLVIALAALTHDFGKPDTTRNVEGQFVAHGHEAAGLAPAQTFLTRLGFEQKVIDRVLPLVAAHLRPEQLWRATQQGIPPKPASFRRLQRDIEPSTIEELVAVTTADQLGRGPFPRPDGLVSMPDHYDGADWWIQQIIAEKLHQPAEPILWGRDLVEHGWPPGPMIGEAVRLVEQLSLGGLSRQEALQIIDSAGSPTEAITSLESLVAAEVPGRDYQPTSRSNR